MTTKTTIQLAHRYELVTRLGSGGMSTVELAFDRTLERYVAVKLLAGHLAGDPAHVTRFRYEALAAASLAHPNIVQVFDWGFDDRAGRHFIVMEHVDGRSCAQLLQSCGRAAIGETVGIIAQACEGLHHAHSLGVVHRDIKPGNLLVSDTGQVKLTDFGIAQVQGREHLTEAGLVLGTVAYVSPEQARGGDVGPRSDIYGLGIVTYELLTGKPPFVAGSLTELALKQRATPAAPSAINPLVPVGLADAVMAALAPDPRDRPSDAIAFGAAVCAGIGRCAERTRTPAQAAPAEERPTTRLTRSPRPNESGPTMIGPPKEGVRVRQLAARSDSPTRKSPLRRAARRTFILVALAALLASVIVGLGYAHVPVVVHALRAISHYGQRTIYALVRWTTRLFN